MIVDFLVKFFCCFKLIEAHVFSSESQHFKSISDVFFASIIACFDNNLFFIIEILMKYFLFFLRVFAHNLRNVKCLLWAAACEIIYNFIFLNYFNAGTISVKESSLNVVILVF